MNRVCRASELDFDPRLEMSRIFVEGFYQWLHFFSKDKDKLTRAFAHMFLLEHFFVITNDKEIAAMAACVRVGQNCVNLNQKEFVTNLGAIKGRIAYAMSKKESQDKHYPLETTDSTAAIEIVAAAPAYKGQGLVKELLSWVMENTPYTEYILDVADTNIPAVHLYQRLGFEEVLRIPDKHPKQSGINAMLYMRKG